MWVLTKLFHNKFCADVDLVWQTFNVVKRVLEQTIEFFCQHEHSSACIKLMPSTKKSEVMNPPHIVTNFGWLFVLEIDC